MVYYLECLFQFTERGKTFDQIDYLHYPTSHLGSEITHRSTLSEVILPTKAFEEISMLCRGMPNDIQHAYP